MMSEMMAEEKVSRCEVCGTPQREEWIPVDGELERFFYCTNKACSKYIATETLLEVFPAGTTFHWPQAPPAPPAPQAPPASHAWLPRVREAIGNTLLFFVMWGLWSLSAGIALEMTVGISSAVVGYDSFIDDNFRVFVAISVALGLYLSCSRKARRALGGTE